MYPTILEYWWAGLFVHSMIYIIVFLSFPLLFKLSASCERFRSFCILLFFIFIPSIGCITCVCIIVMCDTVSRVWINLFLQREVVLAARVNARFFFISEVLFTVIL